MIAFKRGGGNPVEREILDGAKPRRELEARRLKLLLGTLPVNHPSIQESCFESERLFGS